MPRRAGCAWPAAAKVTIPADWRSGYYQVALRATDNGGKFIQRGTRTAEASCYFVLRSATPGRDAEDPPAARHEHLQRLQQLGRLQPLRLQRSRRNPGPSRLLRTPAGQPVRQLGTALRRVGGDATAITLDYAANSRSGVSSGDCWQPTSSCSASVTTNIGPRRCATSWRRSSADGGNVAFFSGNTCCWQVRSEDEGRALDLLGSRTTTPIRSIRPESSRRCAPLWSHHLVQRPENQLTGVGFLWGGYHQSHGQFMDGNGAYTVHRPEHWVFAGTGLKRGDDFGGKDTIVGYECDGCELEWKDGLPFPTHRDGTPETFEVLGTCAGALASRRCRVV